MDTQRWFPHPDSKKTILAGEQRKQPPGPLSDSPGPWPSDTAPPTLKDPRHFLKHYKVKGSYRGLSLALFYWFSVGLPAFWPHFSLFSICSKILLLRCDSSRGTLLLKVLQRPALLKVIHFIWFLECLHLWPQLPLWAHISGFPPPWPSRAERPSILPPKSSMLSTILATE